MKIKLIVGMVILTFISLFFLTTILSSFYTINLNDRGIVLRNGAFTEIAEPGLHWKVPYIDSYVTINNQQHSIRWVREADANYEMNAYSNDQQPADMAVSLTYHIPPGSVKDLYEQFGTVDNLESRLLYRLTPTVIKTVFGKYTAVSVIQDRTKFNIDVQDAVKAAIIGPVVIDTVQVENIKFSDAYEKSVEEAMTARVEIQKIDQQKLQQEVQAKITVINAQAQADAQVAQAKANAEAVKLQGEAQAYAIEVKAKALASNPSLIELTRAEKWNGQLPTTMLPNGTVPFLDVQSK